MTNHYRWDFIGLSTDSKPTPETSEKVADGSTFYCSDTSKLYIWYKDQWYEKESGEEPYELPIASSETLGGIKVGDNLSIDSETGILSALSSGGGVTELTSADYDYPTNNPQYVALWNLDPGVYIWQSNVAFRTSNTATGSGIFGPGILLVSYPKISGRQEKQIVIFTNGGCYVYTTAINGSKETEEPLVKQSVLNNRILNGSTTAPTSSTVGAVGALYSCVNSGTAEVYMCTAVSGSTYTWTKVI